MMITRARWKVADHAKGAISFTEDGSELVWGWVEDGRRHVRVFSPTQEQGEERKHTRTRIGIGYSTPPPESDRSPSGEFRLTSDTGLQPDGFYDHVYVTDYVLKHASASPATSHLLCSCNDHERFFSHLLTDQGVLVYSQEKKLIRYQPSEKSFTTLASGWRALINARRGIRSETALVGVDPESAAGAICLNEDGYIEHTYTTDAPWMGYVEDVDWASKHVLLAYIGRNKSNITTMSQRCGLVDLENNLHAHSEPLGANIDRVALRPGHAECAVLCDDGHLHWLGAEW